LFKSGDYLEEQPKLDNPWHFILDNGRFLHLGNAANPCPNRTSYNSQSDGDNCF
jgi:hypothetical protein